MSQDFHMISHQNLSNTFEVDLKKGLNSAQVVNLKKKHGLNENKHSYWLVGKAVLKDLFDKLSITLWLALVISVLTYQPMGNPPDATSY